MPDGDFPDGEMQGGKNHGGKNPEGGFPARSKDDSDTDTGLEKKSGHKFRKSRTDNSSDNSSDTKNVTVHGL
jgi:hypothetical protein